MTDEEKADQLREKARAMRYKKPIAKEMNLFYIQEQTSEMMERVADVVWFVDNDANLAATLAGDEDDAEEFKLAFASLDADLSRFYDELCYDAWVPDCFDELFPAVHAGDSMGGYLGYDDVEGDYFGLSLFEYGEAEKTAEKRILRLTKNELLEAVGACLKIYSQFVALKYRYDCLDASYRILRDQNLGLLRLVESIDKQYEKAEEASFHFEFESAEVLELDKLISTLPPECWIQ